MPFVLFLNCSILLGSQLLKGNTASSVEGLLAPAYAVAASPNKLCQPHSVAESHCLWLQAPVCDCQSQWLAPSYISVFQEQSKNWHFSSSVLSERKKIKIFFFFLWGSVKNSIDSSCIEWLSTTPRPPPSPYQYFHNPCQLFVVVVCVGWGGGKEIPLSPRKRGRGEQKINGGATAIKVTGGWVIPMECTPWHRQHHKRTMQLIDWIILGANSVIF